MRKPINIIFFVLILLIIGMGAYVLYADRKAKSVGGPGTGTKKSKQNEPIQEEIDAVEQVYNQGADDQRKQDETRVRAALLTGGFSEIGRLWGWKPFG